MPEQQTNIDNYAYERDLILLNNLLMKRLLQQRMRINNLNEKSNNNNNSNTNINNNNNNSNGKKTISDVFVPASSFGHSQSSRDLKKNFSMVEPRKNVTHTTIEQPVMARRSTRQQQPPQQQQHHHHHHQHHNHNSHHHHSHQSRIASRANKIQINTSNISHNTSQNTSEPLSTVNEETQTEKITKLRTISSNSERSDETTVTPCDEKPATSPGNTSNAPTASSSMSATPDSDKSFRKNTPTRPYTSRKSTVSKFNIKPPACKQSSNSKCCDEKQNKKSSINYSSNNSKYVPNTVCNNNMQSSFYPPPPIPPPTNLNNIQMNPFRPYNYQAPSSMNPNPFFYPYNNNYNYSIMRTNFNSYPQFSPLQSFNYQSNPFYLQTSNFFQPRSLEPLKPIKPLPMTHFQQTPLNGQSIIVL